MQTMRVCGNIFVSRVYRVFTPRTLAQTTENKKSELSKEEHEVVAQGYKDSDTKIMKGSG